MPQLHSKICMEAHVYFTNKCSEIYILKIMNHKRKAKFVFGLNHLFQFWTCASVFFNWKQGHQCPMDLCLCFLLLEAGASVSYGLVPLFSLTGSGGISVLWTCASVFFNWKWGHQCPMDLCLCFP
jgi:hypothetical protein